MNRFAAMLRPCLLAVSVAACTDGRAQAILEIADNSLNGGAGSARAGSGAPRSGAGGAGGSSRGGTGGGRSELHAGNGGDAGDRPDPCEEAMDPGGENELTDALNANIENKMFCPDSRGPGLSRLTPSPAWRCGARTWARTQATPERGGRGVGSQVPPGWMISADGQTYVWTIRQSPNLYDAKSALFGDERGPDHRDELCAAAQRTPYKSVGVGHWHDAWVIVVSPFD